MRYWALSGGWRDVLLPEEGTPRSRRRGAARAVFQHGVETVLALTLIALVGACERDPGSFADGDASSSARDSSGIEVQEHREAAHARLWTVEPEAALQLGSEELEGVPPFHRIRGAVILRDPVKREAGVVVADGGSRQLRFFSMAGDLTAVWGGAGEGPGEFRTLDAILLAPPDTVLAFDAGLQRISRFHVDQGFIESFRLDALRSDALGDDRALGGASRLLGRTSDGSLFIEPLETIRQPVEGLWSEEWLIARLDGDGTNPSIVGRFFRSERFVARDGPRASVIARPFGRRGEVRAVHSELLVMDGSFPGYVRYSVNGEPLGVVRTVHSRQPVTAQERDQWTSERIDDGGDATELRQRLRLQAVSEVSFPESHPAVDRMVLDACGFVWVRKVLSAHMQGQAREWLVFRLDDHLWMGSVHLSGDREPVYIGERYLVSIDTTDLGEESVRVTGIDRSSTLCDAG